MKILTQLRAVRSVLTLWYSFVLLIAFGIFGASIYFYLERLLEETLEENLVAEIDWIARVVELEKERFRASPTSGDLSADVERQLDEHFERNPHNYSVIISSLNKTILYKSQNGSSTLLRSGEVPIGETLLESVISRESGDTRVAIRRTDPWIIQVSYPERSIVVVLDHIISIFSLLVPVVLIFSFAGGWVLASIALRPISRISEMANRISAQNLNERIPPRPVNDELGTLIATINRMFERLQASFDQIRRFSMNIAHELRTPLTILKGESELALSKSLSPEESQQLAGMYLEETVRLSRIVDDLLTLAKADAGQLTLQKEPVALHEMIDELYEDALILAAEKELEVTLVCNDRVTVMGDAARLRQLFRNLLMNAVQYTEKGQSITLASHCRDSEVCVTVQDTGIGIPAESVEKIFQPFYRVDAARTRAQGGSGLGLSIVKWITEAHEGTIQVESSPGKGSSFSVRLPALTIAPH